MLIEELKVSIKEIVNGYKNNYEEGVIGYSGKLDIRPKYQREFVYNDKQKRMVIDTILNGLPLNIMYWVENSDGSFELLDGQQRTMSFCEFVNGGFSISINNEIKYFHTLTDIEQRKILDYCVNVYVCKGNDKECLDWFRRINIASVPLTDQELLNINYTGSWLSDAKIKFSKTNCVAHKIGDKFVKGVAIRQELLEIALKWICYYKDIKEISQYMAEHKNDLNANELWEHYFNVIEWVRNTFPKYRKEMKGIDWGRLYKEYSSNRYNIDELEQKISMLYLDEDVTNLKGVFEYVLSNYTNEKVLSIRTFSDKDKSKKYEEQKGICPICGGYFEITEMQGDHIIEWSKGGKTNLDNLQMVCHNCHKHLTKTLYT